ncbi:MAG: hypothetical protein RLZZ127_457, partial [Planctomycetota bacterium]
MMAAPRRTIVAPRLVVSANPTLGNTPVTATNNMPTHL